jgi:protein O-GlcNAc transferase
MNRKERRAAAKTGARPGGHPAVRAMGQHQSRRETLLANALRYYQASQFEAASRVCRQLMALDPNDIAGLNLAGLIALRGGQNQLALDVLGRAVALNDKIADLQSGVAEALQRLGRFDDAIAYYRRAIALDPGYAETFYNCGNVLLKLKRYPEALAHYDRALEIEPNFVEALHNRGNALFESSRFAEALADYDLALTLRPQFVAALSNRGGVLSELKRHEEALASCDQALAIDASNVTALANRGNALFELRRYPEAAALLERLLAIDPDYVYAAGKCLYFKCLYCDWAGYDRTVASIAAGIAAGKRVALPYMLLNLLDSPSAQMKCAQIFNKDRHATSANAVWQGERYHHQKIRVAYLSADFRPHPMAYLMVGLFETHDRSQFETIGVSVGASSKEVFRQRLENSFDRFLDVQTKSDHDVELLLRELEIDIAVDLMGYTSNSRPGILALRPAPIQVNFLGYAGTLGANYIDYVIADRFVIPPDAQASYSERVVYLPDTYYPTGGQQLASGFPPTRSEAGLPETGFVFCCFNQSSRISPIIFNVWMRLLLQVEGSILWLVEDNADSAHNLRQEAEWRGVGADRLVFAPRVRLEDYLARLRLADLFLDTLPYNAHTTASDALSEGLPVVTCAGASFPARVAGSLLKAAGLPELITDSLESYEALALGLARDRHRLAQVKAKLIRNRECFPLFDATRYRRHIESAYYSMWQRHERAEQPASFEVMPIEGE